MTFLEAIKDQLKVKIVLKNDETLEGVLNGNQFLYGQAEFGSFKIKMKEIAAIHFHGVVINTGSETENAPVLDE